LTELETKSDYSEWSDRGSTLWFWIFPERERSGPSLSGRKLRKDHTLLKSTRSIRQSEDKKNAIEFLNADERKPKNSQLFLQFDSH
jgi:hypothetical protein